MKVAVTPYTPLSIHLYLRVFSLDKDMNVKSHILYRGQVWVSELCNAHQNLELLYKISPYMFYENLQQVNTMGSKKQSSTKKEQNYLVLNSASLCFLSNIVQIQIHLLAQQKGNVVWHFVFIYITAQVYWRQSLLHGILFENMN